MCPSSQAHSPFKGVATEDSLSKVEQGLNRLPSRRQIPEGLKAALYLLLNVSSGTCIVFLNKTVFSIFHWKYVYALTLIHTLTTLAGMHLFAALGMYERKKLPLRPLIYIAVAFVGYVVFWNLTLEVSTVGFYQLSKICITPAVMLLDIIVTKRIPTRMEIAAVMVLCIGVGMATVTDNQVAANLMGILVAAAAIFFTAIYQVFAGSKQKQLGVGSLALMAGYTPVATIMLAVLVPVFEPVGITHPTADTLLGFPYTPMAVGAIAITALLGLLVSLSTFLVIGATSPVTFNVIGHVKTVIVLAGGCLLFGDKMASERFFGVCLALAGIFWYSYLKVKGLQQGKKQPSSTTPDRKGSGLIRSVSAASVERLKQDANQ